MSEEKKILYIAPAKHETEDLTVSLKRVAAYCRVSTKSDDQINSYENQKQKYTDMILGHAGWELAGIYADKGISGTSTKNRVEFNRLMRHCRMGKVDLIVVKSVSRFARNTLDTLNYTRKLRNLGIDVYFEEQNIHSIDPASDFMISLHGSLAQSESESLSANVKWGKAQSAKRGKVFMNTKNLLGYTKDEDGNIKIVPEEAETVRFIYKEYLLGMSCHKIRQELERRNMLSPGGKSKWSYTTVVSILKNVKYKGDVLTNLTYTVDPISKKHKVNRGEVGQYYIKNHHPAIIDEDTFNRVQQEIRRRNDIEKKTDIGCLTEHGRYDSRYALTELLFCGHCGCHYKRCMWRNKEKGYRPVWRCAKRIKYGTRYCNDSPVLEESDLHEAILSAIKMNASEISESLDTLKEIVSSGLEENKAARRILELDQEIREIKDETTEMLKALTDLESDFDEESFSDLRQRLLALEDERKALLVSGETFVSGKRLDEISEVLDLLLHQPLEFDNALIRQLISRIDVIDKDTIEITFVSGKTVTKDIWNKDRKELYAG